MVILRATIGLVLISQCLAHSHGHHGRHLHTTPRDHSDNLKTSTKQNDNNKDANKDWTIPDAKLIYKFKQMREDQPVQIEHREDNFNNYMFRDRTATATPETVSNDLKKTDETTGHHHHNHHSKQQMPSSKKESSNTPNSPSHNLDAWNEQSAYPAKIPSPPILTRLEGLDDPKKVHSHHKHQAYIPKPDFESSLNTRTPSHQNHVHVSSSDAFQPQISNFSGRYIESNAYNPTLERTQQGPLFVARRRQRPPHIRRGNNQVNQKVISEVPLIESNIKLSMPSQGVEYLPPSFALSPRFVVEDTNSKIHADSKPRRSNVKNIFSLSEKSQGSKSELITAPSTTLRSLDPIPPVPTLSPWYDNFGK